MLANNLIWSVVLYFIQPVFLIGLLYVLFTRNRRVNYTRETYRVNFKRNYFELKDYLLKGIAPGLFVSLISILAGLPLTIEWYLLYQVVALLLLLIGGYRFIHPLYTFSLTTFVLFGLNAFDVNFPFGQLNQLFEGTYFTATQTFDYLPLLTVSVMFFIAFILFFSTYLMDRRDEQKVYPILRTSKRGKKVAKYQKKFLWVLPLLVIVPGEVIEPLFDWWPLISINGEQYAFLLLPILVGFHYTVSTQLLEEATAKLQKEFRYLALVGVLLVLIAYFFPQISFWSLLILFGVGLLILIRHRRRENMWSFQYGPANEGVRIIAVQEDSPAERLDLGVGDLILEINNYDMTNKESYDKALAQHRSYIKMRVKRKDDEIVITETPLYDDDFNNLGLLILDNE